MISRVQPCHRHAPPLRRTAAVAPRKFWLEDDIKSGQGGCNGGPRTGSTTSDDTTAAVSASDAIGEKPRGGTG